jgi:hypothetical protein
MKKIALYILFFVIVFSLGVSTGHYKHFPFTLLYSIKHGTGFNKKTMLYYGRNFNIPFYKQKDIQLTSRTGIYLTYGQSNAVNGGQYGYNVNNEVYQFLLGETYVYEDPSLGGTGTGGSVWGMVGDKLIEKGIHDKVVFSMCGWEGTKIKELNQGHFFQFLAESYNGLLNKFGRVDGILFHQGEADNSAEGVLDYYMYFEEFLENLNKHGIEIPIYLSRVSLCGDENPVNKDLTDIQNKLIGDYEIVKAGPNTDLLIDKKYRLRDYCHFSLEGYDKFSDMWVTCIENSLLEKQLAQ